MDLTVVSILGVIALVIVFLAKMPVSFGMILVGLVGFAYIKSPQIALKLIGIDVLDTFNSYTMSVIPLFLLMGDIAFHAGISKRLYQTAYTFLGHQRGGLAIASVGGCALFAALCGSLPATVATMSVVALPEMKKYGYDPKLSTGALVAGGTLGVLIPPSVIFVLYGIQTQLSISKLFVAGIIPGVLLALFFIGTIYILCRQNPKLGPAGATFTIKQKLLSLSGLTELIILFGLVMGGLFAGLFTPTEAAAVGALGTIVLGLVRRELRWKGFSTSVVETMRSSCIIFLLLLGTTIFGHFLTVTKLPLMLADWMAASQLPPLLILIGILIIYLIGGCFMGGMPFMVLTLPIFYPIVTSLGYDPIWFGVLMVIMVEIGSITPPVGISLFIVTGMSEVPIETVIKGSLPFIGAFAVFVAILLAFPQIATILPGIMKM